MDRFVLPKQTLSSCVPTPNLTIDFLNIYLHVIILFGFLTLFYVFYISKIETTAMTNEINSQIGTHLTESLNAMKPEAKHNLLNGMKFIPFNVLIKNYTHEDVGYKIHNIWLFRTAYLINMMLILGFLIAIILLTTSCGNCLGIMAIIRHNLFVFSLVGVVEYLFFTNIASKFIPTQPSLMVNTFINNLKQLFNKKNVASEAIKKDELIYQEINDIKNQYSELVNIMSHNAT